MKNSHFIPWLISSGLVYLAFLLIGLLIAGFIPPLSPDLSLDALAEHYNQNSVGVRLFGFILVCCAPLYITFSVAIASYMRRAGASFEMITSQLGMAILSGSTFLISGIVFVVSGFRVETFSFATLLLNDFAWIMLLLPWPSFLIQNFVIGLAILKDDRKEAPVPNWVAYFNFWVAVSFVPSTLLCFFKTGPFAWNGLLVFWLAASVFALWFLIMSTYLYRENHHFENSVITP